MQNVAKMRARMSSGVVGTGEGVEGGEGGVEVYEDELVGEAGGVGGGCGLERGEGCGYGLLLAEVVEGAGVGEGAWVAELGEDGLTEGVDALAGDGRGWMVG